MSDPNPEIGELRHKNARLEQRVSELSEQLVKVKDELQRALARVDALTTTDPETGLLTWSAFNDRASLEIARATRYDREIGLILIAPDSKEALSSVCAIARSQIRGSDLAGRTDRGEVILMLPETSLYGALVVADRMRAAAAKRMNAPINAGCASWPTHARSLAKLVYAARAMLSVTCSDFRRPRL